MKKILLFFTIAILLLPMVHTVHSSNMLNSGIEDFDPLVDLEVTVEIKAIRYLEDIAPQSTFKNLNYLGFFQNILNNYILGIQDFNMYVKVFINGAEFTSDVWENQRYIHNAQWIISLDVPDDVEFVDIKIQLWNYQSNKDDHICDLSPKSGNTIGAKEVELVYSVKTGHWEGDDFLGDPSGYGRLCGTDDGTIYKHDGDAELWFDIYQNDYDGDGIPYWTEVYVYGTDPTVDDRGRDDDNDGVPIEWEWKWGYDPFVWDNHYNLDPDEDSISNYEEYLTSQWGSDPFRKDVFVEMDIMAEGPNGEITYFPENSKDLIRNAFNRQNIVFHLDDGCMGGGEVIPFDALTDGRELRKMYENYFLHGDTNNWRRGVFHYGLVIYCAEGVCGFVFRANAYQISSKGMEIKASNFIYNRDIVYASAYMHELGHTFDFNPIPGHNQYCVSPWQIGWWLVRPYKSCMNYAWMYQIVDYSDGSRRSPDIDDWSRIDYTYFENEWH